MDKDCQRLAKLEIELKSLSKALKTAQKEKNLSYVDILKPEIESRKAEKQRLSRWTSQGLD